MDDISYVGFIYSHPEGDGGNNNISLFHQESILVVAPVHGIHARMIWQSPDIVGLQYLGKIIHFFTAQAIDDTRFPPLREDEFDYLPIDMFCFISYFVMKVGTIER